MLSSAKTELRRRMRGDLARMSPAALAAASENIRTSIPTLPRWQAARTVAAFVPLPNEPDLRPFDWTPQRTLLLPRMDGEHLAFHRVAEASDLIPGPHGVQEPDPGRCPPADPAETDLIFIPGMAFTTDGARLGRGRGFYDRVLARLPATVLRVGVCFRPQIVPEIPLAAHDREVDLVLTPPD